MRNIISGPHGDNLLWKTDVLFIGDNMYLWDDDDTQVPIEISNSFTSGGITWDIVDVDHDSGVLYLLPHAISKSV